MIATDKQLELMEEMKECGWLNVQDYKPEEMAALKQLEAEGLVEICVALTAKGVAYLEIDSRLRV